MKHTLKPVCKRALAALGAVSLTAALLTGCGAKPEAPATETTVPTEVVETTVPPTTAPEPTVPETTVPETTAVPEAEVITKPARVDPTAAHRNDYNKDYVQPPVERELTDEEYDFFTMFWELEQNSMLRYVEENPELIANGWKNIYVNEAGYYDDGLPVETIFGEKVLGIDAEHQILVVEVTGRTYRGVLAIAKDPTRLHLCPAEELGIRGEVSGDIAMRNDGVLAITGSGFIDPNGNGNGGALAGACMCDGVTYGSHYGSNFSRLELHENNWLYIAPADSQFQEGTTDAAEFTPPLVVSGKDVGSDDPTFTENNPRACVGQSSTGEILMLGIEGRQAHSAGTDAGGCAQILLLHDAWTAMNMDGGSSASMWFNGKYVIRCSNTSLSEGRYLPNAWVY